MNNQYPPTTHRAEPACTERGWERGATQGPTQTQRNEQKKWGKRGAQLPTALSLDTQKALVRCVATLHTLTQTSETNPE